MEEAYIAEVRLVLKKIADMLEDLWIEREAFKLVLNRQNGTPYQQLDEIAKSAKSDPELRERARQAFSQMRSNIEETGLTALIEELSQGPPPAGKPN